MKRLLILYHSQGGHAAALAEAVLRGARRCADADARLLHAGAATLCEELAEAMASGVALGIF